MRKEKEQRRKKGTNRKNQKYVVVTGNQLLSSEGKKICKSRGPILIKIARLLLLLFDNL
jgi:hypothetical protein